MKFSVQSSTKILSFLYIFERRRKLGQAWFSYCTTLEYCWTKIIKAYDWLLPQNPKFQFCEIYIYFFSSVKGEIHKKYHSKIKLFTESAPRMIQFTSCNLRLWFCGIGRDLELCGLDTSGWRAYRLNCTTKKPFFG